ncbi:MAG: beta-lactamase family protein [Prevotellaceae bacterium]|jgi:CubicO group peptidase (beta-lactamase class C family)|nr:beta-lactamase family protein [Prevotellaceae bacterium]
MMKKNIIIFAQILLLLTMISCKQTNEKKSDFCNKIDSLFSAIYSDNNEPGAAVVVMKGDSIVFEKCYGIADMQTKTTITPETNFCIASVSKQFSAVAILQLAEQGLLSLNDNLKTFFPEFKADFYNDITLHHILSHTSGIPDTRPRTDKKFMLYSTDVESCQYLIDLQKLNFQPGTQYEYINPTFQLVYQIVPRVTGVDFDTYMKQHIFDVAGMTNSVYFEAEKAIPNMAHGYTFDSGKNIYTECDYGETNFFASKADGGLYTSICDFIKWEKALRDNKIINAESKKQAYSPKILINTDAEYGYNTNTNYGYGWFIQQKSNEPECIYHLGDNGGFTIYAGKIPEKNIILLFFSNRDDIDRISTADSIYAMMKNENWFE